VIRLPTSLDEALAEPGVWRAGGTDLTDLRERGLMDGALVDLRDVPGLRAIEEVERGLRIGARVTLAELARHPALGGWPGLRQAAGALATPQIRAVATVGGSLAQRVRCWYFRNPTFRCLKEGGASCEARLGDHRFSVVVDLGPCVAPHPSTVGLAALVCEATVVARSARGERRLAAVDFFGPGTDPRRENTLESDELIVGLELPPARGDRAAYLRATSRSRAEWPLVEALVSFRLEAGRIVEPRVAVGGVATVPLRLPRVEAVLEGQQPAAGLFEVAARAATARCSPLPQTAYKVELLAGTVRAALTAAME
jgi:xanthine dehydrogenase YagS FAD-binding subunit